MPEVELEKIANVIERVVQSEGLELVHWELKGQGSNGLLRITIDRPTGITHDDCVIVNDQVGTILDVEDLIPYAYTLEISSPGLGRSISGRGDFDRNRGQVARVRASAEIEGRTSFKGRIEHVTPDDVTLVEAGGQQHTIPYSKILAANLVAVPKGAKAVGARQEDDNAKPE